MAKSLKPVPAGDIRAKVAQRVRNSATDLSGARAPALEQRNNGEIDEALQIQSDHLWPAGIFTKGLPHDPLTGQIKRSDLQAFVDALNQQPLNPDQASESPFPGVYKGPGAGRPAAFSAPLYDDEYRRPKHSPKDARGWESPLSGHTFDLQGADADTLGIPPAPSLGSAELTAELGEVYAAALIRDIPFSNWRDGDVDPIASELSKLAFFNSETGLDQNAKDRRRARFTNGALDRRSLFRGSTKGAKSGPYISQFMLIGNAEREIAGKELTGSDAQARAQVFAPDEFRASAGSAVGPEDGLILYGIQSISQQFRGHKTGIDHMTDWAMWLDVQNAANRKDAYDRYERTSRFIATPRDLASYVHFDALYQAYLNATLILLSSGASTDIGLPEGKGNRTRDAFATFGGPHILSLVTEVATRGLKAVRRQKYNVHLRSRPEALAAAVSLAWKGGAAARMLGLQEKPCVAMAKELENILKLVAQRNKVVNDTVWGPEFGSIDHGPLGDEHHNALLPMAFPEGSPMHPSYGAGHATVAGACVTLIKAFFEMYEHDTKRGELPLYDLVDKNNGYPAKLYPRKLFEKEKFLTGGADLPYALEPNPDDNFKTLRRTRDEHNQVTIQGELDKLAANISIGRNFAGVHFYTDYYESLRMGERVAVSILQEQMLTYREPISMRFTSFDDDHIMIAGTGGSRGTNDALVFVWNPDGSGGSEKHFHDWWNRHR